MKSMPQTSNKSITRIEFKRHHITARKLLKSLALIATLAHSISIFEKGRPIKTGLQYLHSSLLRSKMTSTGIFVAVTENPLLFSFTHTPPNALVCTVFERKWLLPKIRMNFSEEVFLIMCFPFIWDFPYC